jgi:chromosome condensin MukBEF ATPase and DNA-binding subunit MukB
MGGAASRAARSGRARTESAIQSLGKYGTSFSNNPYPSSSLQLSFPTVLTDIQITELEREAQIRAAQQALTNQQLESEYENDKELISSMNKVLPSIAVHTTDTIGHDPTLKAKKKLTPEEKDFALQSRLTTATLKALFEEYRGNNNNDNNNNSEEENIKFLAKKYGANEGVLRKFLAVTSTPHLERDGGGQVVGYWPREI